MNNPHLNILAQLAKVDGHADDSELKVIRTVGASKNISDVEIERAIEEADSSTPLPSLEAMEKEEKMELLYNLALVMKADGIIHKEEMKFCLGVIKKLGFDDNVLFELLSNAVVNQEETIDHDLLIRNAEKYYTG